jgi:predicted RNase H-like HicB family nuclease
MDRNQKVKDMQSKDIHVEALWDAEAEVWVASSDDVPGLTTEADTMEHLMQKLKVVIPELLHANGLIDGPGETDIPIHLLGKWQEVIRAHSRNG